MMMTMIVMVALIDRIVFMMMLMQTVLAASVESISNELNAWPAIDQFELVKNRACQTIPGNMSVGMTAMPIAIPILALESAGASLTPSPVMATISHWL